MPFSPEVKTQALANCGRCCCICHAFCGLKIECHHIVQEADGGANTIDNCIPLCFDCHADMLSYDDHHPKGTKYRPEELRRHRDQWFAKAATAAPSNYSNEHRDLDKSVFKRVIKLLPWETMHFLSENNFAGFSFEGKKLEPLWELNHHRNNPEWEFVDPVLESARATLAENVAKLLQLVSKYTFPTKISGLFSVPPEWETENSKHFDAVVKLIHEAADNCVKSYKHLIAEGRNRLAVEAVTE